MRPASNQFKIVERGADLAPRHMATIQREHMSRVSDSYAQAAGVDLDIPQTYMAVENTLWAAWRTTSGAGYVGTGNLLRTTAGTLIDDGVTAGAMRYGLAMVNGSPYAYRAITSNGRWVLQRAMLGGGLSWVTFGGEFGNGAYSANDQVRRIENIIPLEDGRIVAVEGIHQYSKSVTYIRFYIVDAWGATTLFNAIEFELDGAYANWRGANKKACFVTACLTDVGILIVATAHKDGYAVQWTVANGIESDPSPVLPLDSQSDSARMFPFAITKIGGMLHMTAGISRQQADQNGAVAETYYEALLTSSPAAPVNWSFGGLDHFLSANYRNGTLVYIAQSGYTGQIWHVGNGSLAMFTPTPLQGNTRATDLTGRFVKWDLKQNEGNADQFSTILANGDGGLNGDENVVDDGVLYLESGHEGIGQIKMGAYRVQLSREITIAGNGNINLVGQDIARAKLNDMIMPFSGQLLGRSSWRSTLKTQAGLNLVTGNRGVVFGDGGLVYSTLNDPLVAKIQAKNNGNFLACLTVTANCDDEYHLASVGIGVGIPDDLSGNLGDGGVFTISKDHAWTGHMQTKPRLRRFNLPDNKWEFTPRGTALIEQSGESVKILADGEAAYTFKSDAVIKPGEKTDLAMRVFGEWACFYKKTNDMRPSMCAANAVYKLVSRARFSRLTQKDFGRMSSSAIVLGQDTYSSQSAFQAAAWKDVELSLTNAQIAYSSRAGAYNTPITGTVTGYNQIPNQSNANDVSGTGTRFQDELRVGQAVMMNNRVRVIAVIGSQTAMQMTDSINCGGTYQMYVKSSEFWGWATSRHSEQNASGTILYHNPGAKKNTYEIGGRCVFVSNDNTALSIRRVWTDGVEHYLVDSGWDETNPIPAGSPYTSSSDPNNWRGIFRNSLIAKATAASFGLPDGILRNRYMIIGGEVVRYVEATYTKFGENLSNTNYQQKGVWLEIPVVFGVPAPQDIPGGLISPHMQGNPFGDVRVGDLLEISSRNTGDDGYFTYEPDKTSLQRYAAGVGSGNVSTGIYDAPYGLLKPASLDVALNSRDMCIFSGRGALGTTKSAHNPDEWVAYYPVGSDGKLPEIAVHRVGFWSGEFKTVEQGIKKLCGLAGVSNVSFNNAYEDMANAGYTTLLFDANQTATVTQSTTADFTLDMNAPISANGRMSIYFRGYYKLDIFQPVGGQVGLRLQTIKGANEGGVDAYNGERNLIGVDVQVANAAISGNCAILVSAIGTEVVVQVNGQPIWTFDLESLAGNGYDYLRVDPDHVYVQFNPALGIVQARLAELGNEMPDTPISPDQNISSAIGNLMQFTNIQSRATSAGGILFSGFWKRERENEVNGLICVDKFGGLLPGLAGHVLAIGDGASADWINDQVIAKYGYRFVQVRVGGVTTIEQARNAARLALRDMREKAFTRSMTGIGLLTAQAGDVLKIGYKVVGNEAFPQLAPTDFVIVDLELSVDAASVHANWRVREAYGA